MRTIALVIMAAVAAGFAATPAAAQSASHCGVTGTASAAPTITYDPFSSSGLTQISIDFSLTRVTGSTSQKTQQVNFVLTKPVGAPDYQVTYGGTSILYTQGATMGHPQINSQAAGEINYNFGGTTQPDTIVLPSPLIVTVPAGVDLSAGKPIDFDILYVCSGTGAHFDNVTTATTQTSAIHINVNVLSALQASYVGSTLDFGEVGDKTTTQVLASPATYTTPASGNSVRVASSGPYKIQVASQNGYKLTFPGGNLGNSGQTMNYKAFFLGQALSPTAQTFTATTCLRAGIAGKLLPIKAQLLEGGQGKTVAPDYQDTITITISPLLDGATGQVDCPAIPYP